MNTEEDNLANVRAYLRHETDNLPVISIVLDKMGEEMKKPDANKGLAMDIFRDRIGYLIFLEDVGGLNPEQIAELERCEKELARLEGEVKAVTSEEVSREMRQRRGRGRYGEQRLAKKVGGKVVGRSKYIVFDSGKSIQINCQKPPDVVTEMFAFESKWLSHTPANIRKVVDQAIRNCPEGLVPVAVIGDRLERETYYIMTEKDWLDLHRGK